MKCTFWKIAVAYLVIGIFWGAFTVQKGLEFGHYNKENAGIATVTILVSSFAWPISISIGIYRLATE